MKYIPFTLFIALFLSSCSPQSRRPQIIEEAGPPMPPKSLIASNYQSAEIVVTVRITKKEVDKTISADDGTPGYLVTQ